MIEDDLTIVDRLDDRPLGTREPAVGHRVDPVQLAYHRQHFGLTTKGVATVLAVAAVREAMAS